MNQFNSFMAAEMELFTTHRKAADKWCTGYDILLHYFDKYLCQFNETHTELTQEMVDDWCRQREGEKNNTCIGRISPITRFIEFLNERKISSVSPYPFPKSEKKTYVPHYFTKKELSDFFKACDQLSKRTLYTKAEKIKALSVPVVFRLLYSSGMRVTEVRLLKRENIDFETGVIDIQETKGGIQHYVVLHDSMLELLKRFDKKMDELVPDREYLFCNRLGEHFSNGWLPEIFRSLWPTIFPEGKVPTAVPYDFRHAYARENLDSYLDLGFEFDDKLMYLQKSMGHTTVESTLYYYSITPALAKILEEKSNDSLDDLIGKGAY